MRQRCNNPKHKYFSDYGGRGISVCAEWDSDYQAFRDWAVSNGYDSMAIKYGCTLDRIDTDGNYCAENCRWVDMRVQQNNRRNNITISCGNKALSIKEWELKTGIPYQTIVKRLKLGWSESDAVSTPIHGRRRENYAREKV